MPRRSICCTSKAGERTILWPCRLLGNYLVAWCGEIGNTPERELIGRSRSNLGSNRFAMRPFPARRGSPPKTSANFLRFVYCVAGRTWQGGRTMRARRFFRSSRGKLRMSFPSSQSGSKAQKCCGSGGASDRRTAAGRPLPSTRFRHPGRHHARSRRRGCLQRVLPSTRPASLPSVLGALAWGTKRQGRR
jgi:hypothetical protein